MGDIVQFRPRGKERGSLPVQKMSQRNIVDQQEAEDLEIDQGSNQVHIPNWQHLFNDDEVTFRGVRISEYRGGINLDTLEGRNQRVELENALILARATFIGSNSRTQTLKFQAQIRLGKEAYQLGIELEEEEPLGLGRDILVAAVGSSGAARIIENIRLTQRLDNSHNSHLPLGPA